MLQSVLVLGTVFTDSFSFVDRQTDKSNDEALKQRHSLHRKNNFYSYRRPNHFSRIGPEFVGLQFTEKELHLEIFS